MDPSNLRIALFSGNYNYVRDGANRALNKLVDYLLDRGVDVRLYSPTVKKPAFPPQREIVSIPSIPFPGRGEYRFPLPILGRIKRDLEAFDPHLLHISSPDLVSNSALKWAKSRNLPVFASVHTAFETYLHYYRIDFLKPFVVGQMRKLYRQCDMIVAPSESFESVLRQQAMNDDVRSWTRGIDHHQFNPARRDLEWRRGQGIADDEVVVGFVGRIVLEKGLEAFIDAIDRLKAKRVPHRVMAVGDGPAAPMLKDRLPETVCTGFLESTALARAVASMDLLFNPSVTEAFGNVTLEAMASGLPVVAARALGSESLVDDAVTGRLIEPYDIAAYADAIERYIRDPQLRATHGAAGARKAASHDWDEINRVVLDYYLELVDRRKAAAAPTV